MKIVCDARSTLSLTQTKPITHAHVHTRTCTHTPPTKPQKIQLKKLQVNRPCAFMFGNSLEPFDTDQGFVFQFSFHKTRIQQSLLWLFAIPLWCSLLQMNNKLTFPNLNFSAEIFRK